MVTAGVGSSLQVGAATAETRTPWRFILGLWLVVELVYAFYGSAGTFSSFSSYTDYYDRLAEAFRHGQLHLLDTPSAELLSKANPFDFKHRPLWMWDISLHDGRYYLYWGPLPAVVQALGKNLFRINGLVGDQFIQHFFISLSALFGAILIERVARRLFEGMPRWLVGLAILSFGLVNPILYLTATPSVYHTAIVSGQACVLGGLVGAFDAVLARAEGPSRPLRLLPSGIAFGLALACRVSLAPTLAIVTLATAVASEWSISGWRRRVFLNALVLGTPMLLVLGALGAYNKARFGDAFQTGLSLQLTTMKFRASSEYVLANLYVYTLQPYKLSCHFPYALEAWAAGTFGLPHWMPETPGYQQEPTAGWLVTTPITWLLPVAPLVALKSLPRLGALATRGYVYCAACFATMASIAGAAEMGLYVSTMRYLADVTYGLVLSSWLGAFTLLARRHHERPRRLLLALVATLAVASIATSMLLGFQGYDGQFKKYNAALYNKLVSGLSVCEAERAK